jgi:hypothetical protein
MSYIKLAYDTKLTEKEFIKQMNLALKSLYGYEDGMLVVGDHNGYWLEINDERNFDNRDLLSAASKLVLR